MRDSVSPAAPLEHRLAIMTNWAFFASLGSCFILSGFSASDAVAGLAGFAAFVVAFIAHIIINRIFHQGFTEPQIALALIIFIVAVIGFIASWLLDPAFTRKDVLIGIAGFSAIMACFIAYVMINYGVRESYAMMHRLHKQERRRL